MTFQLQGNAPEIYERVMVPLWFGRWADALIDLVHPNTTESVLDVACGTGVTTRLAKERVGPEGRVVGLDVSAPMLAKARDLAPDIDIDWIESDVAASGLAPNSFDVILSQHGYHYFPDKPAALAELHRLLAPNGRMALSIWCGHSPYTQAICQAVETHISPEIARQQRSQRETPGADALRASVQDAGFSNVEVHRQDLMIDVPLAEEFVPLHLGSMPIASAFHALPEATKPRISEHVSDALNAYVKDNRMIYPDAVHVVVGEKSALR